ncbi:MAG TPA: FtsQ-type POTRA domain-containing protein [Geobacteraceae bacterium]
MRELNLSKQKPASGNRFRKQRRQVNVRGLLKKAVRAGAALVVLALVGVISWELYGLVARATFLRLEQIEVKGGKRLSRDDIISQSAVRLGDDLLGLKLRRMGEQLAKNPWVSQVKIRRSFPHTLTIEVAEREPLAVVSMGYLYYLDARAEIFKPLQEGDNLDFPVVTGFSEDDLLKDPAGAKEALKGVLSLIGQLRARGDFTLADISEIHYDKGFGYTLFTIQSGVPVRLGTGGFADKLGRFARIYRDLQAQMPHLEYIDLDYADKIIVKKA